MNRDRAKTQQQIFSDMHRELRTWNTKIPESPDRLDPILKILLQLYSHELARIDSRVSNLWEKATNSLIRSLNPECKRWPVPAYTVMRCDISDPVVEIDTHTRFFFREEREGGQTFFFSPLKTQRLVNASVKAIYYRFGNKIIDLSPTDDGRVPTEDENLALNSSDPGQVYIATEYDGKPTDLAGACVFLKGHENALKQLRWGYWYPSAASGQFYDDSGFCPGLNSKISDIVGSDKDEDNWGGLRTGVSLFGQLENSFVTIPEAFAGTWELTSTPPELMTLATRNNITLLPESSRFYWIKVDLPGGGNKQDVTTPLEAFYNSCIVVNRNELTLFKHTGGNQLVEIEVPESINNILEISSVVDSSGKDYLPRHRLHTNLNAGTYVLEERKDHLVLWFDFSSERGLPPDSITVTYAVTAGTDVNGIGLGKINELYESHPGISGGANLLPTTGAIPAKTEQQVVDEVSVRLRSRDRALSFEEIVRWTTSFDPRIRTVRCENGIERTSSGVRRCIIVRLSLDQDGFCSPDEIGLLRTRLTSFLKSRAPVNTHFQVETSK